MARSQISFEWLIDDSDYAMWTARAVPMLAFAEGAGHQHERRLLANLLRWLSVVGAALIVVAAHGVSSQDLANERLRLFVMEALGQEQVAWQTNDRDLFASLLDQGTDPNWRREWTTVLAEEDKRRESLRADVLSVTTYGDQLVTEIRVDRPPIEWWRSSPYIETRFYRQTSDGWLRSMPDRAYWGSPRVLETPHLRFEYRARDAEMVESIATRMETTYVALHRELGLDLPPALTEKLTFALVPELMRGQASVGSRQELTSPRLQKRPASLSLDEFLAQELVSRMAYLAVSSVVYRPGTTYSYRWDSMVWALNDWVRADLLGGRSPWHEQAVATFADSSDLALPLRLNDIRGWSAFGIMDQRSLMRQYTVSESVVDFVATTYGRERLPELLGAFQNYRNWTSLVPGVYGIPLHEFEEGWNAHLTTKYGLGSARDVGDN